MRSVLSSLGYHWSPLYLFTEKVIKWISDNCRGVVFMLWGGYAQKKAAKVDSFQYRSSLTMCGAQVDAKKHHVLKATHPSPLGANKGGWFGCKHFSKCNKLLEDSGRQPIDWNKLPDY